MFTKIEAVDVTFDPSFAVTVNVTDPPNSIDVALAVTVIEVMPPPPPPGFVGSPGSFIRVATT